jgi:FkbM family methyltransferase
MSQWKLIFDPEELLERITRRIRRGRRLRSLRGTVACALQSGHIDTLELLRLCRENPPNVIYDIGANVGTWTLLARSAFPKSRIEAFEPLSEHLDGFTRLTAGAPDIGLHAVALGQAPSRAQMKVASLTDASSMLELRPELLQHYGVSKAGEEAVEVVRLDDYARTQRLALPDLIKLDIQGFELEALRGGEACLANATQIITEVSFVEMYQGQALFHDVVEFFAQRSFHIKAFGVNTVLGQKIVETDVLFGRSI